MDDETKVCPECGAEFFAHVNVCNRCDTELVSPEEMRGPSPRPATPGNEGLVCLEEGTYDRANELAWALRSDGFEVTVLRAPASSCKGGFGVFVDREVAVDAAARVDELWKRSNPEIADAEERLKKGLCPACGAALMGSSEECPDCGLFVGVADDDCSGDGSCGSCGH
ncbi:MAG TPA: hypothetical protein DDW94_06915 [Deltaproteobacteria bacterium]|nr:MAG: hypothetical protein A2Z79_01445 [Deltaproteobacteria bacterium GWA2_55_82]OGQ62048.1 MAG: hypothetical protein A3I81_03760 [Deltaproteobacteria bacterium RIFCSPLOWO2_02_FULL_55_12]OIJ74095.1 MAG: hypothetical protein A2V21_307355 [Deltaproteobacteria bacterium GWC2_55_46]HBG46708.1 hypothetical protein [Deltaproteobacteria bacterium]HCY11284.1 hypothetical protein [Deltaproteobacteria bacterium]